MRTDPILGETYTRPHDILVATNLEILLSYAKNPPSGETTEDEIRAFALQIWLDYREGVIPTDSALSDIRHFGAMIGIPLAPDLKTARG